MGEVEVAVVGWAGKDADALMTDFADFQSEFRKFRQMLDARYLHPSA